MSYWKDAIPYFTRDELACRRTGVIHLDLRFAVQLPLLRVSWGRPLNPTSVCRTIQHNADVGGHIRSLHLTNNPVHPVDGTMAADFGWADWPPADQVWFAKMALELGWSVGLNAQFIHVDRRSDFGLRKTVFKYGNWDNRFTVAP